MPEHVLSGDQLAWGLLEDKEPGMICKLADVHYDFATNKYTVLSFGQEIFVDPSNYTIISYTPTGEKILHGLGYFFDLAILWYLGRAKNIPPAGRMVSPASLTGGEIFQRGSHVLPLDRLADRYADNFEAFFKTGQELGGQQLEHGDASLRLYPFPRVPVTYILWKADEEFPARVDMFFDATCEQHLPTDVIWSTAMTCVLSML